MRQIKGIDIAGSKNTVRQQPVRSRHYKLHAAYRYERKNKENSCCVAGIKEK